MGLDGVWIQTSLFLTFQLRLAMGKCRVVPISGMKSSLQSNFVNLGSNPSSSKTREKLSM